ncbi:glutamate [NMDA] receptor subunit 1-like [Palaemon carinicauda]|uniref:glutamate [NMDA] receptor subunit 1-like n=1 Tax=Palaemon carinicauda TaxID=392227 RepID=UPI0035B6442B
METGVIPSQRCLKLCVEQWPPFIDSIRGTEPNLKVTGIMVNLVDILSRQLGMCVQYIVAKDRHYGIRLPNGTWTGIMGLLTRKEADMSAIVLSMNAERASAISLSEPLFIDEQAVGHKTPVLEADVAGFVKPYTAWVWLILVLTIVIVAGTTFLVHFLHGFISHDERPGDEKLRGTDHTDENVIQKSIWLACLWTITSQLSQASYWWPKGDSVRMVTGLWLLMAFILGSVYRSNLKAMLIMPRLRLPFNNIEELVNSRIPTFVMKGSMLNQAMESSSEGSPLYMLKQQAVFHNDIIRLSADLTQGKMAAFLGKRALVYLLHQRYSTRGFCDVYVARETVFGGTSLSLGFPYGSSLKLKVDPIIRGLKEAGILEKLYSQGTRNASFCLGSSLNEPLVQLRALSLVDFYGILSFYTAGIVISLIAFFVEVLGGVRKRQVTSSTQ